MKRKYYRVYAEYRHEGLIARGERFTTYAVMAEDEASAIHRVMKNPWEQSVDTQIIHVEYLGEFEGNLDDAKPADQSIFTSGRRVQVDVPAVPVKTRKPRAKKSAESSANILDTYDTME